MEGCYSGGSVAGAVLGTLLALLAVQAAAYYLWRRYWKSRRGQHLVLVTDPEKGGDQYAFDNPCFRDASMVPRGELEKKAPIGTDIKNKLSSWGPLGQLAAVRQVQQPDKRRALDDSFTAAAQVKQVSLRSHDFAGLGFSICGNMRDGIYVKDMLHRGPASESGSIAPGDRIHSIRINLQHIVLEDALTILSYASPYEVTLEVEAASAAASASGAESRGGSSPRPVSAAGAASTSSLLRRERDRLNAASADRICHPFYRSQSIADLAQIGKATSKRPHQLDISTCSISSRDSMHDHPTLKLQSSNVSKENSLTTVASFSKDKMPYKGAVLSPSSVVMVKPERAKKATSHDKEAASSPEAHLDHLHKFGVRVLPVMDKKTEVSPGTPQRVSKPGSTPERHQNEHNTYLERGIDIPDNYSPYTSTPAKPDSHPDFHEIDLGESAIEKQDDAEVHKHKETNVKTMLTKGLQNIKDKLHSLERRKSPSPANVQRTTPAPAQVPVPEPQEAPKPVNSEGQEKVTVVAQESVMMRQPSGRGIPSEIPEEVRMAAMAARSNRKSVGPLTVEVEEERTASRSSSASGDSNHDSAPCTAPKRGNKRKAPKPPEEESPKDIKVHVEMKEDMIPSDSESEDGRKSVPIVVEDVKEKARKAASLVDLSRIDNTVPVGTLERAVSLDLVDGIPQGKKRKAPPVPSCMDGNVLSIDVDGEVISRKEPRLEGTLSTFETGRLKKSSDWGTLEEALKDAPSPDSTTKDCRDSPTSSDNDQVVVLSSPPMSDVISTNDSEEALSLSHTWNRSEPYDSIPEVGHYSFETYSSTTEPLSIEIKGDSQPQEKSENNRAKFLWAVPSEPAENRMVFSVSPDPATTTASATSQVSISGPPSGPTSLTMVSSTPVNFGRISPDSTQPTQISLSGVHVTTMQLNSLEDSTNNAFVTAGETMLQDEEDEPSITPPALPTSPIPVSHPSSLTYITEIQVKATQDKEAPPAPLTSAPHTNGVDLTVKDIPQHDVVENHPHDTNGKCDDEEEESPLKSPEETPTPTENTVLTNHSSPETTPTTVRPTAKSTPTKASRNVSVTAIQGSRIPVRSTSLTPDDRGSRSPIRPPVPARRFSDHGLNTSVSVESSPKRTIPRPKEERKGVNVSLNNGNGTNAGSPGAGAGTGVTVKFGMRGNSEVRVLSASAKNDSD